MSRGIDVSKHQGWIDWKKVKEAGYSFALLRACVGWDNETQIDPFFAGNVVGCEAAGIDWGCYHYSYATSSEEARKEAAFFLRVIQGYKPTFPVWFDFEEPFQIGGRKNGEKQDGYPLEQQMGIIEAFLEAVEKAGYFAGLYMSASPLKRLLAHAPEQIGKYDLWVAQWTGDVCGMSGAGIWQNAVMGHQGTRGVHFTILGEVPGVTGNCDVDIAFRDYPRIIKKMGCNGWGATQLPQTDPGMREKYEGLEAERNAIRIECDALRSKAGKYDRIMRIAWE